AMSNWPLQSDARWAVKGCSRQLTGFVFRAEMESTNCWLLMRGCSVPEGRLTITRRFNAESVEQTISVPKGRLKSSRRRWAPFQACLRCAHVVLSARATEVAGYYRRSLRDRMLIVLPGCQFAAC